MRAKLFAAAILLSAFAVTISCKKVETEGAKNPAFAAIDASFPADQVGKDTVLALPLTQCGIDRDLTFEVVSNGYAKTTFLKKRIYKGVVPGATLPTA